MKIARPVSLKDKYLLEVEKRINKAFFENIYSKLFDIIRKPAEVLNAKSPTEEALRKGILFYEEGVFIGRVSSKVSRELRGLGAVFNKTRGGWAIPVGKIPANITGGIIFQRDKIAAMNHSLISTLDGIDVEEIMSKADMPGLYDKVIKEMNSDILKTITIEANLTEAATKIISEEWAENLDLYIKNWTSDNILELRTKIQANANVGQRVENLVKMIERDYSVSQSKAKFLAKQETSLLMSKMRETRYKDAGVEKYQWSTSGLNNVRDDHKALNGTIQLWASPPVSDSKTGRRNHPGEDFGCNCVAIPVLED